MEEKLQDAITLIEVLGRCDEHANSKKFIFISENPNDEEKCSCAISGDYKSVCTQMLTVIKNVLEKTDEEELKKATALGTIELIMDVAGIDFEDLLLIKMLR